MELLSATQVRKLFAGGISDMTLWRWMHDENMAFPRPIVINRRRYFRASEIEAFQARQSSQPAPKVAA